MHARVPKPVFWYNDTPQVSHADTPLWCCCCCCSALHARSGKDIAKRWAQTDLILLRRPPPPPRHRRRRHWSGEGLPSTKLWCPLGVNSYNSRYPVAGVCGQCSPAPRTPAGPSGLVPKGSCNSSLSVGLGSGIRGKCNLQNLSRRRNSFLSGYCPSVSGDDAHTISIAAAGVDSVVDICVKRRDDLSVDCFLNIRLIQ